MFREMGKEGIMKVLTRKPLVPAREEILANAAARSAKIRGAEKI
jgi:16S rRNA C1402 N4-methylase RsmH